MLLWVRLKFLFFMARLSFDAAEIKYFMASLSTLIKSFEWMNKHVECKEV